WKWGDGTETVLAAPSESEEAPATANHTYTAAGTYTVKLQIKLKVPLYGNPDVRERTFTVGTPVSKFGLKVSKTGSGAGTVSSSPVGINCGSTCEAEFDSGKDVTLTALADAGSEFSGWSGAGCTGTGTCKVTMSAAKEVTATFGLEQRALKVSKSGSGSGTVTSSPSGIDCGVTCETDFDYGTAVTLSAAASPGSNFVGWSGAGCSGTGSCVVTLTDAASVDAQFATIGQSTLSITKSGIGSGPVTSSPAGIDCRGVCQASFATGATVTLQASLNPGTKAVTWTGCDAIVGANECEVVLGANRVVNADFDGKSCAGAAIAGAGSSLQRAAQQDVWAPAFAAQACPGGPTVSYEPTGSGAGMAEWSYDGGKGSVNTGLAFIGTDDAPTAAQIANVKAAAPGAELAVIPVAQTAIAVLANPPAGCSVEAITNSNLAGVMEGRISSWSKVEGAEGSCNAPISRVVRKDVSGTTDQLKNYLFRLNPKGLFCTIGATEGKASWKELANSAWPESCPEKSLSALVRPGTNGGAAVVAAVNSTPGSIGYAALPDAIAGKAGSTVVLELQNNGQKKGAEASFATPAASGAVANCATMTYQVPPPLGSRRDVDWSEVYGAKPAIGGESYPLCGLTYALAFHGYAAAGFSEAQYKTVRDYLYGHVVQPAGQSAIAGSYYQSLPASPQALYDVLGAARGAAAAISY
ncbi:MAG TPA: substrate-binding domain-containing protein, partial [Solirubrobacterales bacterium]|nr:substrate-binding domain-containing protein [Solirubrobacterales bacterium]